ncbi:hypothetical protein DL96DRAFT_343355 [Flagelloscypha sp. PMI_526]|nr:hypothetical protein DL96DRAFT_343355 [Flagelloscypha sp. PMI_526]
MSEDHEKGIALLSLDGGRWENLGVLTQLHVVEDILHKYEIDKDLEEGSTTVSDVFDLVVGTGIGGLVACLLGPLRLSTKDAKDIILRLRDLHVWSTVPISDRTGVLRNALKSLLDSQTGNGEDPLSETQLSDFGKRTPPCKLSATPTFLFLRSLTWLQVQ